MSNWQPIETAPKDGTQILACDCSGDVFICYWGAPYCYNHEDYGWFSEKYYDNYGDNPIWHQPTHWMPLPTLPNVKEDV